jgi:hypothetical protein
MPYGTVALLPDHLVTGFTGLGFDARGIFRHGRIIWWRRSKVTGAWEDKEDIGA